MKSAQVLQLIENFGDVELDGEQDFHTKAKTDLTFKDNDKKVFRSKYLDRMPFYNPKVNVKINEMVQTFENLNFLVTHLKEMGAEMVLSVKIDGFNEVFDPESYETENPDLFQCRCFPSFYGKRCNAPLSSDENHELLICDNQKDNDRIKLECDPESLITVLYANLGRTRQMKCKDEKNVKLSKIDENEDKEASHKVDVRSVVNKIENGNGLQKMELSNINDTITRREDEISSDYDSVL